jgi:type I restriction enzyme S subunit
MRAGWETKSLGEVVEVLDKLRRPITKRDRVEGEYPYYGATGILSYVQGYIFTEKLILIGEDGAKWNSGDNTSFIAEGKYWVNNHAHVVRPIRKIILDEWIVYFLNFSDLTPFITGMTVPKLNQEKMRGIPIPLPPLPEQQRIVAILDECFAALEKAKANAEQNLKNAKELFESYLQGVFENKGEGWAEQLFENCIKLKSGDNLTAKNMTEGEFPVFGGNGIAGYHDEYNLSGSNVIIGRVGALCGNVRHVTEKIWLTDNAFKVTAFKFDFDHSFLTYLLNYKDLRSYARQAAQPVISNSSLKDVILYFPKSIKEQQTIVRKLDTLRAETQKLEAVYQQKLADLEELKKSILQKAFAGELTAKSIAS